MAAGLDTLDLEVDVEDGVTASGRPPPEVSPGPRRGTLPVTITSLRGDALVDTVEQAKQTQLQNIQTRTGKSLDELFALIRESGLTRHGQILQLLKRDLGMGHGDANALAGAYLKAGEQGGAPAGAPAGEASPDDVLDVIYAGPKADLRPIHDKVLSALAALGPFDVAPKKGYVSLRRKKQFATVGPRPRRGSMSGLNMKGVPATARLTELPAGGMCQYRVSLTDASEVDDELMGWVRQAYASAG